MALKISSTTVINNSRDLTNINAIGGDVVATEAEAKAGTITNKVITPATLKTVVNSMSGSNFPSWDSLPSTFDPTLTFDEYGRGTARAIGEAETTSGLTTSRPSDWEVLAPNDYAQQPNSYPSVLYYGPEAEGKINVRQFNLNRSTYTNTNSNALRNHGTLSTKTSIKPLAYYFNNVAIRLISSGSFSGAYIPRGHLDIYLNNATIELPREWVENSDDIEIRVWGTGALYGRRMADYPLLVKGNSEQRIYDR